MKTSIRKLAINIVMFVSAGISLQAATQDAIIADIASTRNETVLTHNELGANLKGLLALTGQSEGDLRPTFEAFKAGLPKTTIAKERTAARVATLIAAGQQHFSLWQADIESISDKGIKKHAVARLEDTRKRWYEVITSLQEAVKQFDPLLGYLHDIDTAISYDLTVKGVRSVRGAADSATDSFRDIQKAVAQAVSELEKMAKELGSVIE